MTGYESNLLKLIPLALEKHTTELKNLNTNIQNLNINLENINSSLQGVAREFNTFNNVLLKTIVTTKDDLSGFRCWLSQLSAW